MKIGTLCLEVLLLSKLMKFSLEKLLEEKVTSCEVSEKEAG